MKARLPQGYNTPGAANLQQLARQAQKMQEQMEAVTGKLEVKSVEIKPEVIDPEDAEMLGDLVTAAVNEALRAAAKEKEEKLSAVSGGMAVPGLL